MKNRSFNSLAEKRSLNSLAIKQTLRVARKKGLVTTFFPREEPACVLTFLCINYNEKYSMLYAAEHQDRCKILILK